MKYIGFYKQKKRGTIIQFICPHHQDKGVQNKDWSHFRMTVKGCSYCTGRGKSTIDIQNQLKDKNIKILSDYINCETPIDCLCLECGYRWKPIPRALTSNGSGCPMCGLTKRSKNRTKTTEQFKEDLYQVNPSIQIIGEYKGAHKKIKCKCLIDGYEFESYPSNLLNLSCGCPKCNMSLGEKELLNVLDKLHINYKTQHTIQGCELIHPLRFDAFDVDRQIAFEYNGEQHYRVVDFTSKNINKAQQSFEQTKMRDNKKIEFCKEHNIPIIIVPYWERRNMQEFIQNELNKINVFRN